VVAVIHIEYGDINEAFYIGMENNFRKALKFMEKNGLLEKFRPNAENCVRRSSSCGYGFADAIESMFYEYYP
jgi:hypothetical protein